MSNASWAIFRTAARRSWRAIDGSSRTLTTWSVYARSWSVGPAHAGEPANSTSATLSPFSNLFTPRVYGADLAMPNNGRPTARERGGSWREDRRGNAHLQLPADDPRPDRPTTIMSHPSSRPRFPIVPANPASP